MEQILSAVLAALPALAAETATSAVRDSYQAVRKLIQQKWSKDSDIRKTLDDLEREPNSDELTRKLRRHIATRELHKDQEFMLAIKRLTEAIAESPIAGGANVRFKQSGGTFKGVGAIGRNTGDITFE